MGGLGTPIRPIKRNKSNLGGLISIQVLLVSQFTPGTEWPKRSDIAAGILSAVPPLVTTEKAGNILFDVETGASLRAEGKGPSTNKVYEHLLDNITVSGHEAEVDATLDKLYNEPCVAIVTESDGKRFVLGSTFKPLFFEDEYDSGATSDKGRATKLKAKTLQPLDFRPPQLATSVTIAVDTIPAQT